MSLSPAFHEIVVGSLTALNCAIGNALASSLPMVKVTGPQEAMRESDGCIVSILFAFLKPEGVPSNSPICQMYVVDWARAVSMCSG